VWTGRVASQPAKAMLVDPTLRTPHDYLLAGFPKQAIKIMQAHRTWIGTQDDMRQTPLHVAAQCGFVEAVRWLLANGADVNARCYNEFTPLLLAGDDLEMVKLLLGHKADVNARGVSGTAFQQAAGKCAHLGQFPEYGPDRDRARAVTKVLLDAGAEYDLVSACCLDDLERVRTLTADKREARNPEAMRMAATHGRTAIVKLLLERGADPENAEYGDLPLSYFALDQPEVLKLLLDAGADAKVRIDYHGSGMGPQGSTLLHEAAGKGVVQSARLLVARGVGIDARNAQGDTPLDLACFGGHPEMVNWLLRNKANVNAHADRGRTPMSHAARRIWPDQDEENARCQAVIRSLERAGVELDVFAAIACNDVRQVARILQADPQAGVQRTQTGLPALHLAVILDRKEIVKLLLDKGIDPNVPSQEKNIGYPGETALLEAAFWGRLEIAEMLVKHGASVNASAERGIAPLHEAARTQHLELARLLLEHGADVNAKDNQKRTPLDWCNDGDESPEIAELLRKYGGVK
jgi:ankyrin repeat protein